MPSYLAGKAAAARQVRTHTRIGRDTTGMCRLTVRRHLVFSPRVMQQAINLVANLLLGGRFAFDVNVTTEHGRLLRNLAERADNLAVSTRFLALSRAAVASSLILVERLVGEGTRLDRLLIRVSGRISGSAHLVFVEATRLYGLLHVLRSRRCGRQRERRVVAFGNADDVEDDLRVRRHMREERAAERTPCGQCLLDKEKEASVRSNELAEVDLLLPVRHLLLQQLEALLDERLAEEGKPKTKAGEHSPIASGHDGKDDGERKEDLRRESFARVVRRVRLRRRDGAVQQQRVSSGAE